MANSDDIVRDELTEQLIENLQAVMAERKIKATTLARSAGISMSGIRELFKGESKSMTLTSVTKLAAALDMEPVELLAPASWDERRKRLVEAFLTLPPDRQDYLIVSAEALAAGNESEPEDD